MRLDGIAFSGFRSFGRETQRLSPLSKVTLLAGVNNSGKSNVLHVLYSVLPALLPSESGAPTGWTPGHLDEHGSAPSPFAFEVGARIDGDLYNKVLIDLDAQSVGDQFRSVWAAIADEQSMVWLPYTTSGKARGGAVFDSERFLSDVLADGRSQKEWYTLGSTVSTTSRQNRVQALVIAFMSWMTTQHVRIPEVSLVPAVRQIGVTERPDDADLSGRDLIRRIAELQGPSILELHKKDKFNAINRFLQSVTEDSTARLEVPGDLDTIHVTLRNRVLPLSNLGTGIHEVVMLAAWSTIFEDRLICLEEPEIHLHPLMQRKLLRYLAEETSNQYVVATHSAHFLDQPEATVFHVTWDGEQTRIDLASTPSKRVALCADLGYMPSDLLQTNAIIWVEGPSDRLYVRRWIQERDPTLVEHVHYTIMFYGGRLLNHLTADDVEIEDFISLRSINQWLAIVVDSDRDRGGKRLNLTKQRVQRGFDQGRGFAWITNGREIENYVPVGQLRAAVEAIHPLATMTCKSDDRFAHMLAIKRGKESGTADKVKVAHHIAESSQPVVWQLDLKRQVDLLVKFVRTANGLAP